MSSQMGLTEFFAMEASEYLERLDALVSAVAPPEGEEFLRLARALRGSALMANQQAIAGAAAAFETLARSVRAPGSASRRAAQAHARPDGYTLGTITAEINILRWRRLTRISWRDFTPIMLVNGDHLIVRETMEQVVELAIEYGRSLRKLLPPS